MDRQPPSSTSNEIDLYIRTIYSLLKSSGEVRVRAMEEAHCFSNSSLHPGARSHEPDIGAFGYSAGRLPECMPDVERIVLGQSGDQFERAGLDLREWDVVTARGRRRAMRWDGEGTLAVFVTSVTDIDDLVPIVAAYQIEWNKMRDALTRSSAEPAVALGIGEDGVERLRAALGSCADEAMEKLRSQKCDLKIQLLSGSFREYQRSAKRWWTAIEANLGEILADVDLEKRPVYFVSSNTHSIVNLIGGYAAAHREKIIEFCMKEDPEGLKRELEKALEEDDEGTLNNYLYYLLRTFLHEKKKNRDLEKRVEDVQQFDAHVGVHTVPSPGKIDVAAQLIDVSKLQPERLDYRLKEAYDPILAQSDAVIINIDYPLGMAAYHHLSRIAESCAEVCGLYIMGKAATLNGRVGDVGILKAVYDEHSRNTYLVHNSFSAGDVQPYMRYGTVLDNQKAVTVRSAYLQNRDYMGVFYDEGYSIMEMEAGPYLSAGYEMLNPDRHPNNEIVNLSHSVPFDIGFLHYASDTPYSRRQSLLSKSMSFFGVESTYACAIAITRRIMECEAKRLKTVAN